VRHERRWIVQGRTGCYTVWRHGDVPPEEDTWTGCYTVWRHGDVPPEEDTWTCTCKGYHFKSRHRYRYHCRHIQAIRAEIIADFEESL